MKTRLNRTMPRRQSGSAVLVVFMLVALLSAVVGVNTLSLRRLKEEIQLIEQQQLKKFTLPPPEPPGSPAETNRTARALAPSAPQ